LKNTKEQVILKSGAENVETKPDTEKQKKICRKIAQQTIVQKTYRKSKKPHAGHFNARRNKWADPV
jgi:hypothetical protein